MAISLQNQSVHETTVPPATHNSSLNYSGESPVFLFLFPRKVVNEELNELILRPSEAFGKKKSQNI